MKYIAGDSYFDLYREMLTNTMYMIFYERIGPAGVSGMVQVMRPDNGLPMTYEHYLSLIKNR